MKWEPSDWRRPSSLSLVSSYEKREPWSVEQLALPDKPSIAVLPFQNMSGDPEQEYFADGIVEDIITALSRFKSLFVIARSSSFAYKDRSPDIRQGSACATCWKAAYEKPQARSASPASS